MKISDYQSYQNKLKNIVKTRILTSLKRALTYCREYFYGNIFFLHPFKKIYTISCSITVSWTEIYCCIVDTGRNIFLQFDSFLHFNTKKEREKKRSEIWSGLQTRHKILFYFFGLIGIGIFFYVRILIYFISATCFKVLEN